MKNRSASIVEFLRTGIWLLPTEGLSRPKAAGVRSLKILLLSIRGFREDRCSIRASALTFYSLLSIVPVVAMFFGIAKGFGLDKKLQNQLLAKFAGQEQILLKVFAFSDTLLQRTRGGVIAGVGVALLFWTVIKLLGHIEQAFNDVWKVEKSRTLSRKLSDYLSVMVICPIIFVAAGSMTVTMASQVRRVAEKVAQWGVPPAPILLLLDVLPFVLIWVLFAFLYIYMPNTKVRYRAGLIAGVATGTAYQGIQWVYILFQVGVAKANAVYGSFAALPLLLGWIQLSWMVVLVGSELSFAIQNVDDLGFPAGTGTVPHAHRKRLSLLIARLVARNFSEGAPPLTAHAIANSLRMPYLPVRRILSDLTGAGLLSVTKSDEYEEGAYQPALDIHRITVSTVLDALERSGTVELVFPDEADFRSIAEALGSLGGALEESPANRRVIDL